MDGDRNGEVTATIRARPFVYKLQQELLLEHQGEAAVHHACVS